tara:strand:+ start:233 stop:526 length:294 start_codon:yes stop_codon:yes gene_type:complete
MTTAAPWQRNEIARITDAFTKSGKAKRVYEPSRDIFVSDAEYQLALTMRVKLCDKPQHQGDRVMICNHTNFYYEKRSAGALQTVQSGQLETTDGNGT